MEDLLAARWQMAVSLGFHIIFSCIAMAMPFFMVRAQLLWSRTNKEVYRDLARQWAKGVAVFFAVGAVSGTVLSMELGLLWPEFMRHAGPIIGMPFSLEGLAFFIEAIALAFFLYGEGKVSHPVRLGAGIVVGVMGIMSGVLVVSANSWMNSPTGFDWVDGKPENIDPWAAMFNPGWFHQALHMSIAAFVATGFAVVGVHAFQRLRHPDSEFHRRAIEIVMPFAVGATLLQFVSGDLIAKQVARLQPEKLAAMEGQFETLKSAPLRIGGIPNEAERVTPYSIEIPGGLSFLATGDFNATIPGLEAFPEENWPPVAITHYSFQIMVGIGVLLAMVSVVWIWQRFRRQEWFTEKPIFLWTLFALSPLGFIAIEAGWIVTEVGRQPWIIYHIMRTEDALTSMPGLSWMFYLIVVIYLVLTIILIALMSGMIRAINRKYDR
ncbi:MAG: cytochrome ubiquinol oxidase subunit I [Verrucomicrobiales bacterium]|nr:cytochrome ubiquinol oxidase subunit I [Verrucomicrobiales bacterium]